MTKARVLLGILVLVVLAGCSAGSQDAKTVEQQATQISKDSKAMEKDQKLPPGDGPTN